jgi:3-methyladenine DNA glycosylase AlkD
MSPPTIRTVMARLRAAADPARAKFLPTFFKTGPGQYGEGDRFLGLSVPQIRRFAAEYRSLPLARLEGLLESPWHEARLLALVILVERYRRAPRTEQSAIVRLYLHRTDRVNNWDLVDVSAPDIVGAHLLTRDRGLLTRLVRSTSLWERRIAIVATYRFIRERQYADTLDLATRLLGDREDLMHKAVGWMLREVGKRDEPVLRRFLDRHAPAMPRTTLRYAIERLPPAARRHYLAMPRTRRRA